MTDLLVGTWDLVPELSIYESGEPPHSGTYVISRGEGRFLIQVFWNTGPDAEPLAVRFSAPDDGSEEEYDEAPGVTHIRFEQVNRRTLDSWATNDGNVVAYARRVVSHQSELLAIAQEFLGPDGCRVRNFQVYRRNPG